MARKKNAAPCADAETRRRELKDLIARARDVGDLRVELDALKELSKLEKIYERPVGVENAETAESARLAREHLEGLGIAPSGLPLEELARLAALEIIGRRTNANIQRRIGKRVDN